MVRFIAFLTPIVFATLIAGWASAADRTETTKTLKDGSVKHCVSETDFAQTKDGALVIRTAWVCTITKKVAK